METLHTVRVIATGGRNGRVQSENGSIRLPLSSVGSFGTNYREGTNSEQLFGAAYGACFSGLLQLVAEQLQIKLQPNFSVTSNVSLQKDNSSKLRLKVSLDCYLPNLTEEEATKLIKTAHDMCPYTNAMQDNATIDIRWLNTDKE